jgi:hypothetical protein
MSEQLGNLYDGMIPGAEPWADMMEREAIVKSIRKALYGLARDCSEELHPNVAEWLALYDLPPSVVAWVLEGQP